MREPIGNLLKLIIDHRGKTPTKLGGEFSLAGVPVLSAKHVKTGGIIGRDDLRYADSKLYRRWMSTELEPGDILLTSEAPLGEVYLLPEQEFKFILGQRLFGLRAKEDVIDSRFLYYALTSPIVQHRLQVRATGTTALGIRQSELLKVEIDYPEDLEEQRRIAHILGTLDDKLELNRQLNATLEQLARALFQSWFVDFDPVRAKASGEAPDSICRRLGLTPELLALFPAELEASALGEVPVGWELGCLGDIANNPRQLVQPEQVSAKTPYIGLEHMPRHSIALSNWEVDVIPESGKYSFVSNSILFGKLRPYFHKVGVAPVSGICSTDIVVLLPCKQQWHSYLLNVVSNDEFVASTSASSTGTKMPRTSWPEMSKYKLALPPDAIAQAFNNIIDSGIRQILSNIHESRTLAALRDELLPKLLYGGTHLN